MWDEPRIYLISDMSESAAIVKSFFHFDIAKNVSSGYTANDRGGGQGAAGKQPEHRLRGQTKLGFESRAPAMNFRNWDGIKAINPRGLGTESPDY